MGKRLEESSRYWDEHVKIQGNIPIAIGWLDSPLVLEQCLKKLKVKNKVMNIPQWLLWVKEKYINSKREYGLSLGCGDSALERHAISLNICSKFDAYDISKKSIEIAKKEAPEKYKIDLTSGDLKERIYRPSIEFMNNYDPSEAIRSNDIVPLVAKYFDIEERIDYGGTILHILLQNIVGNFNPSKEEDIAILRLLCYIEEILIKEKVLPSDFAIIVARNNK